MLSNAKTLKRRTFADQKSATQVANESASDQSDQSVAGEELAVEQTQDPEAVAEADESDANDAAAAAEEPTVEPRTRRKSKLF